MKIIAISAHNKEYKKLNEVSEKNKTEYFKDKGIIFVNYELEQEMWNRPVAWTKIKLIRYNLMYCDYVIWLDCDTCIINKNFDLKGLLASDKDIYLSKDNNGINSGVMVFKNTNKVKSFLDTVWSMEQYVNHIWWEQAAIHDLYENNWEGINEATEFVPQNILNAYEYGQYNLENKEGEICKDTFIAHFPALPLEKRIELINKYTNGS